MDRARDRLIRLLALLIAPPVAVLLAVALVRDGVRVEADVVYGQVDGHRLLLDNLPRAGGGGAPARRLLAGGMPPQDVARNLGVSVPTLYRWVPAASR